MRGDYLDKEQNAHCTSTFVVAGGIDRVVGRLWRAHSRANAHDYSDRATHRDARATHGDIRSDEYASAHGDAASDGNPCAHSDTAADEHAKTHSDESGHAQTDRHQRRSGIRLDWRWGVVQAIESGYLDRAIIQRSARCREPAQSNGERRRR